jgi:cell division transport system permease protein
MRLLRSDLPLDRESAWQYLPWILAMMVYLAALALAGATSVGDALEGWKRGLVGQFTIQILPVETGDAAAGAADETTDETAGETAGETADGAASADRPERAARVQSVIDYLKTIEAVETVRVLDAEATRALVEPWLGPTDETGRWAFDLPLPDVVAVTAREGASLSAAAIEAQLRNAGIAIAVDDHGRWAAELVRFGRSLQLLAALVVAIVAAAGAMVVYFVTRTGLAVHARVIEVAHLVGARDIYIARQIQRHALWLGLLGGTIGMALAAATWWALGALVSFAEVPFLPGMAPDWTAWLWYALLIPAAGLLAMTSARRTVFATLRKMM